jgi:hypothetical protein
MMHVCSILMVVMKARSGTAGTTQAATLLRFGRGKNGGIQPMLVGSHSHSQLELRRNTSDGLSNG